MIITKRQLKKLIQEQIINEQLNSLNSVKKGDYCYQLMERDNPQLGTYYVWEKLKVARVTPTTIIVDWYGSNKSFNKSSGYLKSKGGGSVYGSSYYTLFTVADAKIKNKELLDSDARVRGFKD